MMPTLNDPKFIRDLENLRNKKLYTREEVDALIKATVVTLTEKIAAVERKIQVATAGADWVYPCDKRWVGTFGLPLTSTSWDGDSFSTTAKTLINLSTTFGVPPGVRAVYVRTSCHDDASASGDYYLILSPNDTAGSGLATRVTGVGNASFHDENFIVPCNSDGNIYYQIAASGANKFDAYIQIWGYLPR